MAEGAETSGDEFIEVSEKEEESKKGDETPDSCNLLMEIEPTSGEEMAMGSPFVELGTKVLRGERLSKTPVLPIHPGSEEDEPG